MMATGIGDVTYPHARVQVNARARARSRRYARIEVYEERKLRKLHTKGTRTNPRGQSQAYQFAYECGSSVRI